MNRDTTGRLPRPLISHPRGSGQRADDLGFDARGSKSRWLTASPIRRRSRPLLQPPELLIVDLALHFEHREHARIGRARYPRLRRGLRPRHRPIAERVVEVAVLVRPLRIDALASLGPSAAIGAPLICSMRGRQCENTNSRGEPSTCAGIDAHDGGSRSARIAETRGIRAVVSYPIVVRGRTWGARCRWDGVTLRRPARESSPAPASHAPRRPFTARVRRRASPRCEKSPRRASSPISGLWRRDEASSARSSRPRARRSASLRERRRGRMSSSGRPSVGATSTLCSSSRGPCRPPLGVRGGGARPRRVAWGRRSGRESGR
jgi:hypothetical protein